MDYPESEEEGNSQQETMAAANSILDADDMEMTNGTCPSDPTQSRQPDIGRSKFVRDTQLSGQTVHPGSRNPGARDLASTESTMCPTAAAAATTPDTRRMGPTSHQST